MIKLITPTAEQKQLYEDGQKAIFIRSDNFDKICLVKGKDGLPHQVIMPNHTKTYVKVIPFIGSSNDGYIRLSEEEQKQLMENERHEITITRERARDKSSERKFIINATLIDTKGKDDKVATHYFYTFRDADDVQYKDEPLDLDYEF